VDYHLTKTESLIMNKVKHSYLPALHQNLQQQLTQQPTQAVVSQQDRQQQRQQQQQIMTNSEHMICKLCKSKMQLYNIICNLDYKQPHPRIRNRPRTLQMMMI